MHTDTGYKSSCSPHFTNRNHTLTARAHACRIRGSGSAPAHSINGGALIMHRHRRNPRRRPAGRRTNPRAWRHHKAPNHSNLQGGEETRARGKRGSGADLGVDPEGRVARRLLRVVGRRREPRHLVARGLRGPSSLPVPVRLGSLIRKMTGKTRRDDDTETANAAASKWAPSSLCVG